jgi:hypothetical protein
VDKDYNFKGYTPQYFATEVIAKEWVQPIDASYRQFKAWSDLTDAAGNALVTAYTVERPDKRWSVMLVNRDQYNDHAVKLVFADPLTKSSRHFSGQVDRITFGSNEYVWHQEGEQGHADPDGPPSKSTVNAGAEALFQLPKASITVLRGSISTQ